MDTADGMSCWSKLLTALDFYGYLPNYICSPFLSSMSTSGRVPSVWKMIFCCHFNRAPSPCSGKRTHMMVSMVIAMQTRGHACRSQFSLSSWCLSPLLFPLLQLGTIETMKLTMKELYSSRVESFKLLGRQSHPRRDGPDFAASIESGNWQLLGHFTAENKRGTQSFQLSNPVRARYVLLLLDTHYGNEQMCALNGIEVLGVSAAQELEEALSLEAVEDEAADELELIEQQRQQWQQQQTQAHQQQQQEAQMQAQQQAQMMQQQQQQGQAHQQAVAQERAQQQEQLTQQLQQVQQQQAVAADNSSRRPEQHQQAGAVGGGNGADSAVDPMSLQAMGSTTEQVANGARVGADHGMQPQLLEQGKESGQQAAGPEAGAPQQQQQQQQQAGSEVGGASGQAPSGSGEAAVGGGSAAGGNMAGSSGGARAENELQLQQPQQMPADGEPPRQDHMPQSEPAAASGTQPSPLPSVVGEGHGAVSPGLQVNSSSNASAGAIGNGGGGGAAVDDGSLRPDGTASTSLSSSPPSQAGGVVDMQAGAGGGVVEQGGHQQQQPPQEQQQQHPTTGNVSANHAASQQQQQQQQQPSTARPSQQQHIQQQPRVVSPNGNGACPPPSGAGNGVPPTPAPTPAVAAAGSNGVRPASPPTPTPAAAAASPPATRDMVLEGRGSTKPKQAGNLFDVIKSEMVQLKLEQGKSSKRVDSLTKKLTELEGLVVELVQQNEEMKLGIKSMAVGVETLVRQEVQDAVAEMLLLLRASEPSLSMGGDGESGSGGGAGQDGMHGESRGEDGGGRSGSRSGMGIGGSYSNMCPKPVPRSVPWKVALLLYVSMGVGLGLALLPKSLHWAKGVRSGVIVLAAANGMLAVFINLWLILAPPHVFEDEGRQHVAALPLHRMLPNASWS